MDLSRNLKNKRDAEARLKQQNKTIVYNSGTAGPSITDENDLTDRGEESWFDPAQPIYTNPSEPTAPEPETEETGDPADGITTGAYVFRKEFADSGEWIVSHGLGNDPVVSVWIYENAEGFGTQLFGTSPFGGVAAAAVRLTDAADVTRIDENSLRVSWPSPTYGKVVCMG